MYSDPVTYRKILRVLVIGFSAVIVLLMAAGFIGLESAQLIQENSAEIVHNGLVTTRLDRRTAAGAGHSECRV